jgi:hypothetical protein
MDKTQLRAIKHQCNGYAKRYMDRAGPILDMMQLKRTHCAFVAKNCRLLAMGEGWSEADVHAAESLGFLHDIGRFSQLEEYGTFKDADSINHGERSYQVILESNLLVGIESDRRDALLNAVRYHNAIELRTDLPAEHLNYLKLIRDADRLDIYRVVYDALAGDKLVKHPEICLGLPVEAIPSAEVLARVEARQYLSYDQLKNSADFLILILSWCYQMHYPATCRLIDARHILADYAAFLPMHLPAVARVIDQIELHIGSYAEQV